LGHFRRAIQISAKVKIAITAGLSAKWNMEINPKHPDKGQGFLKVLQVGSSQYLFLWC